MRKFPSGEACSQESRMRSEKNQVPGHTRRHPPYRLIIAETSLRRRGQIGRTPLRVKSATRSVHTFYATVGYFPTRKVSRCCAPTSVVEDVADLTPEAGLEPATRRLTAGCSTN